MSNYFKNLIQEVPKILSNYFKNQIQEDSFKLLQISVIRDPQDSFKLLQKPDTRGPRDSLKLHTSKTKHRVPEILSNYFKNEARSILRDSFKLKLQKQNKMDPQDFFKLFQKRNTRDFWNKFNNKTEGVLEILSNYFKTNQKLSPEILLNYFKNKTKWLPEILSNHFKN